MSESTGAIILSPRQVATGDPTGQALENVNTSVLGDGALCYVMGGAGQGQWQLQKASLDAPNGTTIVAPIAGPGRWFLKSQPGAPPLVQSGTNAQTGTTYQFGMGDDAFAITTFTNADPIAVTIPDDSTYPFPTGTRLPVYVGGDGAVTFTGESLATIESIDGYTTVSTKGASATLWKRGENDWVLQKITALLSEGWVDILGLVNSAGPGPSAPTFAAPSAPVGFFPAGSICCGR